MGMIIPKSVKYKIRENSILINGSAAKGTTPISTHFPEIFREEVRIQESLRNNQLSKKGNDTFICKTLFIQLTLCNLLNFIQNGVSYN